MPPLKPDFPYIAVATALLAAALAGCRETPPGDAMAPVAEYRAFRDPRPVTIRGYADDAMEPFVTKDGRYLLFNNKNDPRIDIKLLYAERVDDLTFDYRGEIRGANTKALEGVPSLDDDGNLFFVSTRDYAETLSTAFRGRFRAGEVSGVGHVPGISLERRGMLVFDVEISGDGNTLFIADGRFAGGHVPETADIDIAVRDGATFRRLPSARALLKYVNTGQLEYASAVSRDLRELFFTRLDVSGKTPRATILRAARASVEEPFGPPERIAAIDGFAEAPALSADGRYLYYHRAEAGRFLIYRVER